MRSGSIRRTLGQLLLAAGLAHVAAAAAPETPSVSPDSPRATLEIGESPALGPADAPVTIVEFADFQCPFCARGATIMDRLAASPAAGQVRWVFKHYPLPGHGDAPLAHRA